MRCFGNGKPNLSSTDATINKRNKTIFNHFTQLTEEGNCQNYNGTTLFDPSGLLKKTHSFEMLNSLQYGQALCAPCDIPDCSCSIILPNAVIDDLSQNGITGLVYGSPIEVPWDFVSPPQSWNANDIILDASGINYFTLCGPSGNTWIFDGSSNIFDGSGATNFDGSGVCYNALQKSCVNLYLLNNPVAVNLQQALVSLGAAGVSGAPAGARPRVTLYNYLRNVSGFKHPSRIRFRR